MRGKSVHLKRGGLTEDLYEKYGYHYLKDIVNYGGGRDRLYGKDLSL